MLLRSYRPSDLETLCRIDRVCFPPGIAYSLEELSGFIRHRSSRTWVAEEGAEIVGFLVAGRQPPRVGHIITIDVVDPWRRKGVGRALMDAAEDWAHRAGIEFIYLETADNNLTAQRFYESRGYQKADEVENYYGNGHAAWVMVKQLTE